MIKIKRENDIIDINLQVRTREYREVHQQNNYLKYRLSKLSNEFKQLTDAQTQTSDADNELSTQIGEEDNQLQIYDPMVIF